MPRRTPGQWESEGGAPPLSTDLPAESKPNATAKPRSPRSCLKKSKNKHAKSPTVIQLTSLNIWLGKCPKSGVRSPSLVAIKVPFVNFNGDHSDCSNDFKCLLQRLTVNTRVKYLVNSSGLLIYRSHKADGQQPLGCSFPD